MAGLLSDLSDVARIESGRLTLDLEPVDISDVVKDAVEGLRPAIEDKDQVLRIDVPDDLPSVQAEQERLVQVLTNLIKNAHQFTPPGGRLAIRAECRDDELVGHGIIVAVEDNGIGIEAEEQEKVFEKFYRSDDRAASDVPGSGLGLTIAASLVEMHGGRIWLESVFREGTTVYVALSVRS
jgi:signal transduction histidine kinase